MYTTGRLSLLAQQSNVRICQNSCIQRILSFPGTQSGVRAASLELEINFGGDRLWSILRMACVFYLQAYDRKAAAQADGVEGTRSRVAPGTWVNKKIAVFRPALSQT